MYTAHGSHARTRRTGARRIAMHLLGLAALATLTLLLPAPASADTPSEPCPVIFADATLQTDCLGPLQIAASNVTVDLNDHAVACVEGFTIGVLLVGQSGDQVTGGRVHGCTYGLVLRGTANTFSNLRVDENVIGIDSFGDENAFVSDYVGFNSQQGAVVAGNRNRVSGSVFEQTGLGLTVGLGTGNRVFGTRFLHNSSGGYEDQSGHDDSITGSYFDGNASYAILVIDESTGATIQGNVVTATRTGAAGAIVLARSSHNTVRANRVADNEAPGVRLISEFADVVLNNSLFANTVGILLADTATTTLVSANTSRRNSIYDMQDDSVDCDANLWLGNHFETANQTQCIR